MSYDEELIPEITAGIRAHYGGLFQFGAPDVVVVNVTKDGTVAGGTSLTFTNVTSTSVGTIFVQGRGLGSLVGSHLAHAARNRGIKRFTATMAASNTPAAGLGVDRAGRVEGVRQAVGAGGAGHELRDAARAGGRAGERVEVALRIELRGEQRGRDAPALGGLRNWDLVLGRDECGKRPGAVGAADDRHPGFQPIVAPRVDADLPTGPDGLVNMKLGPSDALWGAIFEKAYAFAYSAALFCVAAMIFARREF